MKHAARGLRRAPAFTIAAVATLALGIATNTLVFTVLNAIVWRPLPVPHAESMVRIFPVNAAGQRENLFSAGEVRALAAPRPGIGGVAAYLPFEVTSTIEGRVQSALAYAVSSSYLPLLGVEPARGRAFSSDEERTAGRARVVVISHGVWTRTFAASEEILGGEVRLNGVPFTVVGVAPQGFVGTEPLEPHFWVPLAAQPILESRAADTEGIPSFLVIGRLAGGTGHRVAADQLSIAVSQSRGPRTTARASRVEVVPATFFHAGPELTPLLTLTMASVALVLIIACANAANLVLTRATARRRELGTRAALGASTGQLAWHLASESLLLSVVSGAVGLLLSAWTLRLLYPFAVQLLPFEWATVVLDIAPDVRVFAYTMALALAAGAFLALWPLVESRRMDIRARLGDQGSILGTEVRGSRLRNLLVVVQMAVCLMLLAAAAVSARALERTKRLDVGISPDGVVHTSSDLARHGYDRAAAAAFYARMVARAEALPGVTEVALTTHVPLTGGVRRVDVMADGASVSVPVTFTMTSPGYFRALSVPIIEGRDFSRAEAEGEAPVTIVSAALARRFWPGQPPLGRRLSVGGQPVPLTVIGVVRDASDTAIWLEKEISIYAPASTASDRNLRLLVKSTGDTAALAGQLRREAHAIDPQLQFDARPMTEVLALWMLPLRVAAAAASALGTLALALAALGVYGVVSYTAAQRRRELGIRLALGASGGQIVSLVLGSGGRMVAAGLVAGLAGAIPAIRLAAAMLPGAGNGDWVALLGSAFVLTASAILACYIPARAASHADPLVALRAE